MLQRLVAYEEKSLRKKDGIGKRSEESFATLQHTST